MSRSLRAALLIILILAPVIFYKSFNKERRKSEFTSTILPARGINLPRSKIALIFDDLGESLKELKEVYSLGIPLTIAVIPGLKFSNNIAHIGSRCGFSVLIHLPLEPKKLETYKTDKYRFIGNSLNKREIDSLLKYYLNSIRIAIGVNNHMGSLATEDVQFMRFILGAIKRKGLIFIDSRTSLSSCGYEIAKEQELICGYNEGFLDSVDTPGVIKEKLKELVDKAKEKGKIIVIAHPKKNTLDVLKEELPGLKREVDFVTVKDYFQL